MKEREQASPPWGRWTVLDDDAVFKVKRIEVLPGKRLSYQKHSKREEHWHIVKGEALATIDGRGRLLRAGSCATIDKGALHRIENVGRDVLIFIEVQTGEYFGEDDIVRVEDDFGRAAP